MITVGQAMHFKSLLYLRDDCLWFFQASLVQQDSNILVKEVASAPLKFTRRTVSGGVCDKYAPEWLSLMCHDVPEQVLFFSGYPQ